MSLRVFNFAVETRHVFYEHEAPRRLLAWRKTYTDRQTDGRKSRTQKRNVAAVRSGGFSFSARTRVPTRWMNWGNMFVTIHCQLQFLNTVGISFDEIIFSWW